MLRVDSSSISKMDQFAGMVVKLSNLNCREFRVRADLFDCFNLPSLRILGIIDLIRRSTSKCLDTPEMA